MPSLSFYTLFDSSTIELPVPAEGEFAFTYFVNTQTDFVTVNEQWVLFINNFLNVPFELDYVVTDIFISGMSYGDVTPWVVSNRSCVEASDVTPLVESLVSSVATNHSAMCNNLTFSATSSGDFCLDCGTNAAGTYRCFDPKNGTLSLPGLAVCYD